MALYLRRQRDGERFLHIRAGDWIVRFAGQRNWEVVWGPLFRGKFGDMADQVSMVWLWNKVRLRFSSRRGGPMQREVLGYMLGSFGLYVDELVARIRALGGHHIYWLNITDRDFPFLAVIEHTNFIGPEHYGGQHVLYISNYLSKDSPLLRMDEEELWRLYRPYLGRINPAFDDSWVTGRWLFRGPDAQPVFTVENAGRVPPHRTPVQGLYLANMGQIFPEDRGQNYSIRLGETVASLVAEDL
jgi:protoporphyrinogen oxidase